ncbi:hypothetical protein DPMN_139907 [Dreissena polymorpha]|uniref:Uncharacterized protein n=1 Tax=Dreissena polymorpha TaxID=45954 RepID=A0A9D4GCE8_DREPO|nr:hypothetical protein DPMN_139730 [Dreissena polymorpha]KAH3811442.1 hypothetical protein DPMN_139852 [Dreissena polymorpha]KAH3811497.1 hypothetical protein DPMN_139907 [Dreissena polymorpha]
MITQEVHREQRARQSDRLGNSHPPCVRLVAARESRGGFGAPGPDISVAAGA